MRRATLVAIVIALLAVAFSSPAQAGVSFGFFYSNLSPHGSWLVSGRYGRVWRPGIYRAGWNPYADGHWAYADVGWTWVSDYPWGDITYHYGTWSLDPELGWVWIPGYVWAPAWVDFRIGPDYIGWGPVAPAFWVGASVGFGAPERDCYTFVAARDFLAPHIGPCTVPRTRFGLAFEHTNPVESIAFRNNLVVTRGPDRTFVERVTQRTLVPEPLERVSRAAPFPGFTRASLAVDPHRMRTEWRAAEPVSARRALPGVAPRAQRHVTFTAPSNLRASRTAPAQALGRRTPTASPATHRGAQGRPAPVMSNRAAPRNSSSVPRPVMFNRAPVGSGGVGFSPARAPAPRAAPVARRGAPSTPKKPRRH